MTMSVFSVTLQWEDEREGEWIESVAVLASTDEDARAFAVRRISDRVYPNEVTVATSGQFIADLEPRLIATLVVNPNNLKTRWAEA